MLIAIVRSCWSYIAEFWNIIPLEIRDDVFPAILLAVGGYLAYIYGLRTYFRQREHELILKRYLTEGIDRVAEQLDEASRIFLNDRFNAAVLLNQLKGRRDVDLSFKFQSAYIDLARSPLSKIDYLTGDDTIHLFIFELIEFFVIESNTLDTHFRSLLSSVHTIVQGPKDPPSKEFEDVLQKLTDLFKSLNKRSFDVIGKRICVLGTLQELASILERERDISWRDLSEFKHRTDVKQLVGEMKRTWEELKKEEQSNEAASDQTNS